jgi:hypothetical protein
MNLLRAEITLANLHDLDPKKAGKPGEFGPECGLSGRPGARHLIIATVVQSTLELSRLRSIKATPPVLGRIPMKGIGELLDPARQRPIVNPEHPGVMSASVMQADGSAQANEPGQADIGTMRGIGL